MRKYGGFLNLSPREVECLTWAAQGKTYREISIMLEISFGSVKTYLDSARFKVGGVNLTHTVALAITYGKIFMTDEAIAARKDAAKRLYGEFGTSFEELDE